MENMKKKKWAAEDLLILPAWRRFSPLRKKKRRKKNRKKGLPPHDFCSSQLSRLLSFFLFVYLWFIYFIDLFIYKNFPAATRGFRLSILAACRRRFCCSRHPKASRPLRVSTSSLTSSSSFISQYFKKASTKEETRRKENVTTER